jgi:hypothetical protein
MLHAKLPLLLFGSVRDCNMLITNRNYNTPEFTDVVETIVAHESSQGSDLSDIYIWMDTLVVNQHEAPIRQQEWWSSTFHNAIKEIGSVILIVEPWHGPKVLTRAWCL